MNDEELMRRTNAWWKYYRRVCCLERWLMEFKRETLPLGVLSLEDYETIEEYKYEIKDAYNEAEIASQRLFGMSFYDMRTAVPSPRNR